MTNRGTRNLSLIFAQEGCKDLEGVMGKGPGGANESGKNREVRKSSLQVPPRGMV